MFRKNISIEEVVSETVRKLLIPFHEISPEIAQKAWEDFQKNHLPERTGQRLVDQLRERCEKESPGAVLVQEAQQENQRLRNLVTEKDALIQKLQNEIRSLQREVEQIQTETKRLKNLYEAQNRALEALHEENMRLNAFIKGTAVE